MILDGESAPPEVRSLPGELRFHLDEGTGARRLVGYAAVWGALSAPLRNPKGEVFFERAARGAFLESLDSPEVGCYFNHNYAMPLGRTGAGTLTVAEDDHGLLFQCTPPATTYAADLAVSIDRGDVWGCSIGFYTLKDQWGRDGQGRLIRTVLKGRVFDVGPVSIPAIKETAVALRSLDRWLAEGEEAPPEPDPSADDSARIAYLDRRLRLAALSAPRRPR